MRTLRLLFVAALAVSTVALVPSSASAAAPTAPYTAVTVSGHSTFYPQVGSLALDAGNAYTFSFSWTSPEVLSVMALSTSGSITMGLQPPTGQTWAVGTYSTDWFADATHAQFTLGVGSAACDGDPASLTVTEVVREAGTGAITAFAASYSSKCTASKPEITTGELRWHSSVPYAAATTDPGQIDFGSQPFDLNGTPKQVTITSRGSSPIVFGTAALSGAVPAAFAVTADTCSGQTVAYGETCVLTVTPHATAYAVQTALLVVPDNTSGGQTNVALSLQGANTRSFTSSTNSMDFGVIYTGHDSETKTVKMTGTNISPVTFGTVSIVNYGSAAFVITSDTCSGAVLGNLQTCSVSVKAHPNVASQSVTAMLQFPNNTPGALRGVQLTVTAAESKGLTVDPYLQFGSVIVGQSAGPKTLTVTAAGPEAVALGTISIDGADAQIFTIVDDSCSGVTLQVGTDCTVTLSATTPYVGGRFASLLIPNNSSINPRIVSLSIIGIADQEGTYYPLAPERIMDSRTGIGISKAKIGAGAVAHLQVAGRGGVPAGNVSAVVLNVTVTGPTAGGYLTVYPGGVARPTASSLNFTAGWTGANSVTVGLGANGKVDIFNSAGRSDIIVDVVGYYAASAPADTGAVAGGRFQPTMPERLFDSRSDLGFQIPAGLVMYIPVSYGYPANQHIRALALNITAVSPRSSGYLTAWDGGDYTFPETSTLNFGKGKTVPNMAIVPTSPCVDCGDAEGLPTVGIYTSATVDLLVDIVGFYDDGQLGGGYRFQPMTPTRIVDTRSGLGASTLGAGATAHVTTPPALIDDSTQALALNVTGIAPTSNTYLTLWPHGYSDIPQPTISNLNPAKGQTVPNAAITLLGPTKMFNIFNASGRTNVAVDVVGTFYPDTNSVSSFSPGTATIRARKTTYALTAHPEPKLGRLS
ncbi:hypothetical protein F4553_004288 [Allocatelliglobosispora scoriae]|uniref:Choice-of-anchor D domain-containing protein n=1 Tax=Allocatelliglobosispora scoriae TaxID=643052 RepID=A0A841BUS5_9ACTN|nr:choice-of-anchor D domain-containing protein [Allocatelliglobosispora scoriae]MBB5870909.1 hypothetical protein [Allocatelliglobosispora scoriae]